MPDLEVKIKTTGADQAAGAVQDVTKSTAGLAGAQVGAGAAAEKHSIAATKLRRVFQELNSVVPGLGALIQAAFSPIGAAISIAVMALRGFRDHMRAFNEECKRLEEEAAKPLTNRIEAIREGTVQAAVAMAEFHDKLAEAARGEQSLADQTTKAIQANKQQIAMAGTHSEAMKNAELVWLEALHKAKLMSDDVFNAKRLQKEEEFLRKKRELAEMEEQAEILIHGRMIEQAKLNQPELTKKAEEAKMRSKQADEDLKAMPTEAQVTEQRDKAAQDLKNFLDRRIPLVRGILEGTDISKVPQGAVQTSLAAATSKMSAAEVGTPGTSGVDEYYRLKAKAIITQKQWDERPDKAKDKEIAAIRAKRMVEILEKQDIENVSYVTEGEREQKIREVGFQARRQSNAELNAMGRGQIASTLVTGVMETEQKRRSGEKVTEDAMAKLNDVANGIMRQNLNIYQAINVIERAMASPQNLNEAIRRIALRLKQMESREAHNR